MYFSPSVADATATTTTPAHPRLPQWRERGGRHRAKFNCDAGWRGAPIPEVFCWQDEEEVKLVVNKCLLWTFSFKLSEELATGQQLASVHWSILRSLAASSRCNFLWPSNCNCKNPSCCRVFLCNREKNNATYKSELVNIAGDAGLGTLNSTKSIWPPLFSTEVYWEEEPAPEGQRDKEIYFSQFISSLFDGVGQLLPGDFAGLDWEETVRLATQLWWGGCQAGGGCQVGWPAGAGQGGHAELVVHIRWVMWGKHDKRFFFFKLHWILQLHPSN